MKVTRLDLDGTGSPMGLVTRILKIEKHLPIPVPIEELARQLDIEEIAPLETQRFEGGLVTRPSSHGLCGSCSAEPRACPETM